MPTRGILPVSFDWPRSSAAHARPLWLLACLREFSSVSALGGAFLESRRALAPRAECGAVVPEVRSRMPLMRFLRARVRRSVATLVGRRAPLTRGARLRWWRREPRSVRPLRRPARHMARGIVRAALCAGRCTGRIYPKCHRALRSFAADERTALGAVHDLQPASLPTSPRLVSEEQGSVLEATTMRGLSGTRWRLWLAFLATLVLASCVEASADTTPPSVPTAVTAWAVGCHQINLAWNASTDTGGSGLGAYNVYVWQSPSWMFLKQVLAATTSGGCNTARYTTSNTGLTASTTYYYSVAAVDKAGNVSLKSTFVGAALPACVTATTVTTSTSTTLVSGDRTSPAMPTGLKAAPATCSQINLTWLASTDTGGSGLKGYNVYR